MGNGSKIKKSLLLFLCKVLFCDKAEHEDSGLHDRQADLIFLSAMYDLDLRPKKNKKQKKKKTNKKPKINSFGFPGNLYLFLISVREFFF